MGCHLLGCCCDYFPLGGLLRNGEKNIVLCHSFMGLNVNIHLSFQEKMRLKMRILLDIIKILLNLFFGKNNKRGVGDSNNRRTASGFGGTKRR